VHKERLSLDQLHATQVYSDLTPRQKILVETFIGSNGDRVAAVKAAYTTKSGEVARVMAYEAFASPRVIAALAAYFQSDPLEDFKAELRKAYRNKRLSIAQFNALKLHAEVCGWTSDSLPDKNDIDEPETSKPQASRTSAATPVGMGSANDVQIFPPATPKPRRPQIGDIVRYENNWYKATALGADGEVTAGDRCDGDGNLIPEDTL
jgi:hypothetical protein